MKNAHQLSNLRYRTVDKLVQEDAFKITLNSGFDNRDNSQVTMSGVSIKSKNTQKVNILSEKNLNSILQFSVKLASKPIGDVMLSMFFSSDRTCDYSQNITNALNKVKVNHWQTLSIDLACFSQHGVDLTQIIVPFELASVKGLEMSMTNIKLLPKHSGEVSFQCN